MDIDLAISEIEYLAATKSDVTCLNKRCDDLLKLNPKSWAAARCWLNHRQIDRINKIHLSFNQIVRSHQKQYHEILKKFDGQISNYDFHADGGNISTLSLLKSLNISPKYLGYLPKCTANLIAYFASTENVANLQELGEIINNSEIMHSQVASAVSEFFPKFGLTDLAISITKEAYQSHPMSWMKQRIAGETLIKCEKYVDALDHYNQVYSIQKNVSVKIWSDLKYTITKIAFLHETLGNFALALENYFAACRYDVSAYGDLLKYSLNTRDRALVRHVLHGLLTSPQQITTWTLLHYNVAVQFLKLPQVISTRLHQVAISSLLKLNINDERDTNHLAKNRYIQIGALAPAFPYTKMAPDFTEGKFYSNYNTDILEKYGLMINLALNNTYGSKLFAYDPKSGQLKDPSSGDIEIFLPDALFTEKKKETPAHEQIRKIFSALADRFIANGHTILPRHQFRNGLADPTYIAKKVFSYHTHADFTSASKIDHWHFKESHLAGTYHLETGGYSGWSNMNYPENRKNWFIESKDKIAKAYVKNLRQQILKNNSSKYTQSNINKTSTNSPYCVLVLQIIDDAVATFANIKPYQLIETCVNSLANTGTRLVIKRHPMCSSAIIKQALDKFTSHTNVEISTDSLHALYPNANAIITTNSGAGFEALVHGKPVITVGKSDYTDYTNHCTTINDLKSFLQLAINNKLSIDPNTDLFIYNYLEYNVLSFDSKQRLENRIDHAITRDFSTDILAAPESSNDFIQHTDFMAHIYDATMALARREYIDFAKGVLPLTPPEQLSPKLLMKKTSTLRELSDLENWQSHNSLLLNINPRGGNVEEVKMMIGNNTPTNIILSRLKNLIEEYPDESFFLLSFVDLQRNVRFKDNIKNHEFSYSKSDSVTDVLSVAKYLNSVGRPEEAYSILKPLMERSLSSQDKNRLNEHLCQVLIEKGDYHSGKEIISNLRWLDNSNKLTNFANFLSSSDIRSDVNHAPITVIVTDIRFEKGGKGSHARIKRLCEIIEQTANQRVVVAYYGELSDIEFGKEILKSNQRQWIPLILKGMKDYEKVVPYLTEDISAGPIKTPKNLSRFYKATLRYLLEELNPGRVIYEYIWSAPLHVPGFASAIDTHDLQYERTNRLQAAGINCPFPVTRNEEADSLKPFDTIIAITDEEANGFREIAPNQNVITIPHLPEINHRLAPTSIRKLGFIGGDQKPNVDGISWFLRENWPLLKSEFELHIYGDVCKQIPRNLVTSSVILHGRINDLDDAYSFCDAFIAPLLTGSGLKIKVVEAMAESRIVFATPVAAEGIQVKNNSNPVVYSQLELLTSENITKSSINYEDRIFSGLEWIRNQETSLSLIIKDAF